MPGTQLLVRNHLEMLIKLNKHNKNSTNKNNKLIYLRMNYNNINKSV